MKKFLIGVMVLIAGVFGVKLSTDLRREHKSSEHLRRPSRFKIASRSFDRAMWAAVHHRDPVPELHFGVEVLIFGTQHAKNRADSREQVAA